MGHKNKILKKLFFAGLFVSPFIFNPYAVIPFEIPKVLFIRFWIEVLVIAGITAFKKEDAAKKIDKPMLYILVLFLGVILATAFTGYDLTKSWTGNYYRDDGIFMLLHYILLGGFIWLYAKSEWIKNMLYGLSASAVMLSLISILIWFAIFVLRKYGIETWIDGGIGLAFGNPNFLAGYILISLPATDYVLSKVKKTKRGYISFVIWLIVLAGLILTKAWSGIIGFILFMIFKFFTESRFAKIKILLICSVFCIAALAFSSAKFVNSYFGNLNFYKFKDANGVIVAESRSRIFVKGVIAVSKRPLLGYGYANFDYAFKNVDWPIHFANDVYVDKAHSSVLETAVTTGIFGLVLYVVLLFMAGINLCKIKTEWGRAALTVYCLTVIHMQTNVVSVSEELMLWILIAVALAHPKGITPKERRDTLYL